MCGCRVRWSGCALAWAHSPQFNWKWPRFIFLMYNLIMSCLALTCSKCKVSFAFTIKPISLIDSDCSYLFDLIFCCSLPYTSFILLRTSLFSFLSFWVLNGSSDHSYMLIWSVLLSLHPNLISLY